ncbi:hypothetical protein LMxysn_0247 [Listeria monocytogenes]|nr:hypothetical protein LMxysn_0247 [Listeria monocytogenes]
MILAHKKTDAEKGVNRIGQKREFGIFILKGGEKNENVLFVVSL